MSDSTPRVSPTRSYALPPLPPGTRPGAGTHEAVRGESLSAPSTPPSHQPRQPLAPVFFGGGAAGAHSAFEEDEPSAPYAQPFGFASASGAAAAAASSFAPRRAVAASDDEPSSAAPPRDMRHAGASRALFGPVPRHLPPPPPSSADYAGASSSPVPPPPPFYSGERGSVPPPPPPAWLGLAGARSQRFVPPPPPHTSVLAPAGARFAPSSARGPVPPPPPTWLGLAGARSQHFVPPPESSIAGPHGFDHPEGRFGAHGPGRGGLASHSWAGERHEAQPPSFDVSSPAHGRHMPHASLTTAAFLGSDEDDDARRVGAGAGDSRAARGGQAPRRRSDSVGSSGSGASTLTHTSFLGIIGIRDPETLKAEKNAALSEFKGAISDPSLTLPQLLLLKKILETPSTRKIQEIKAANPTIDLPIAVETLTVIAFRDSIDGAANPTASRFTKFFGAVRSAFARAVITTPSRTAQEGLQALKTRMGFSVSSLKKMGTETLTDISKNFIPVGLRVTAGRPATPKLPFAFIWRGSLEAPRPKDLRPADVLVSLGHLHRAVIQAKTAEARDRGMLRADRPEESSMFFVNPHVRSGQDPNHAALRAAIDASSTTRQKAAQQSLVELTKYFNANTAALDAIFVLSFMIRTSSPAESLAQMASDLSKAIQLLPKTGMSWTPEKLIELAHFSLYSQCAGVADPVQVVFDTKIATKAPKAEAVRAADRSAESGAEEFAPSGAAAASRFADEY